VATPIGNLGDIGLRALETLRGVEAVAAEDTRVTRRLLAHHGIVKRVIPVHEHNERRAVDGVLALLRAGRSVALTCDAGTPAISDPGAALVAAARAAGFQVTPVPGPSAAIAALSVCGLAAPHHLFYGFLPARAAARRREISALAHLPFTLVFFEAPHRVEECISDLRAVLGGARRIVIARELTKLFESVHACTLAEAGAWLAADADRCRGEFVLIVEGAAETRGAEDAGEQVLAALLSELPLRQAVDLAARITGGRKNELYRRALAMQRKALPSRSR
jgi:16S rRNA (cytidine1402-2'-O)-methyltransferase